MTCGTQSGCTCYAFILAGGRVERRFLHCPVHGQNVAATGRPSEAFDLGQKAVDRHAEALRKLAES